MTDIGSRVVSRAHRGNDSAMRHVRQPTPGWLLTKDSGMTTTFGYILSCLDITDAQCKKVPMRMTLTLEPEIAEKLRDEAAIGMRTNKEIEHQAELQSCDTDFQRFPSLRWSNPLQP